MDLRRLPRHWMAALVAIPLLVWWLGWYPGFGHTDTIDQWNQLKAGVYSNYHPAIHTFYLDLLSLDGTKPGLVTLIQIGGLTALLVYGTKWLIGAGVPFWVAVGVAWAMGLSPAIPPTTLALWKDVPFGLFLLWAWIELLALSVEEGRQRQPWAWIRLGVALAGVWLFRANGLLTVAPLLIVLLLVYRRQWRNIAVVMGTTALVVAAVISPLYRILDVRESSIEPAEVFLADIAASFVAHPSTFDGEDLRLLETVAPYEVWRSQYDCYDSNALLFHPDFDHGPVREEPGPYRALVLDVYRRDFAAVAGHRVCAANFLYAPLQPEDSYFHRPPYDFPPNDVGLRRVPISDRAFAVTDFYWRWAEVDHRLWLTWRPAIVILPALAVIALFVFKRRALLVPSTLFLLHLANVAATSPVQEYRYAYPLYLVGMMTVTLVVPVLSGGDIRAEKTA
jgi:hypothetical protein